MIDVGGQRGERRKWLNALDDVLCLVWTVGLIEYQQVMYEDNKEIRIKESLNLFQQWANNKNFSAIPIIVAFTKKDVFYDTYDAAGFKRVFPDFAGEAAEDAVKFMEKEFKARLKNRSAGAAFTTFVLDATSAEDSLELVTNIRQQVANSSSGTILDAVQATKAEMDEKKNRRGSTLFGRRGSSVPKRASADLS